VTLYFTKEEKAAFEKEINEVFFTTSFGFLNAHRGLRRGAFHLLLGTTGGGKSTLVRTIIRDFIFKEENKNLNLALLLSEESVRDYRVQASVGMPSSDILLNTHVKSELDELGMDEKNAFAWIRLLRPDVLIFDNITTSSFYMDKTPQEQAAFAKRLKALIKELDCAAVIVAHTDAKAKDNHSEISLNDIRGSKSICNLCEFAYILQRFSIGEAFFPTLRVAKHRSQELIHNLYALKYDHKIRAFTGDEAISYEKFKRVFNERNRLT
jgi:ABC-type iron transport system FetAB ATPase subunit